MEHSQFLNSRSHIDTDQFREINDFEILFKLSKMSKTVRPRSVKSSAEDTPAVMTYEQLQARNIRERKELFRQMGFDKLKDELAARKKKPNKPKKEGPLLPS